MWVVRYISLFINRAELHLCVLIGCHALGSCLYTFWHVMCCNSESCVMLSVLWHVGSCVRWSVLWLVEHSFSYNILGMRLWLVVINIDLAPRISMKGKGENLGLVWAGLPHWSPPKRPMCLIQLHCIPSNRHMDKKIATLAFLRWALTRC